MAATTRRVSRPAWAKNPVCPWRDILSLATGSLLYQADRRICPMSNPNWRIECLARLDWLFWPV